MIRVSSSGYVVPALPAGSPRPPDLGHPPTPHNRDRGPPFPAGRTQAVALAQSFTSRNVKLHTRVLKQVLGGTPIVIPGTGVDLRSRHLLADRSEMFAIDWLKRGILIERETSVSPSAAEAVAAAKLRAHDVARRHPGQEPDTFRLVDATGKILGVFPKKSATSKSA